MKNMVFITVDKRRFDGALQVQISNGSTGFRIAGPKYNGNNTVQLLKHVLTKRDAEQIKRYLSEVDA
jgi:hypothetical protein